MYDYLKGKLVTKSPTRVVLDVHGVGYLVLISLHTYSLLKDQENCQLYISFQVREDAHSLFGFAEENERQLFEHLISVSGIGPNTARTMLSSQAPDDVESAIVNGDVNFLKSMKGIGPKTAQRVILELQDKLKKISIRPASGESLMTHRDEATNALLMLGFQKAQIEKALSGITKDHPGLDLENIIKTALKRL